MPKQTVIILVALGIVGGVLILAGILGAAGALLWFTQRPARRRRLTGRFPRRPPRPKP